MPITAPEAHNENKTHTDLCRALGCPRLGTPALAQNAKTLDELLQMIETAKISESDEYRKREALFRQISASSHNC